MTDAVTTFVTFNMPSDAVDTFKTAWLKDAAFIAKQPGYKGNTLYKRIGGDGKVEFINVAHWETEKLMNLARDNVIIWRQKDGGDQVALFEELGVSVSAESYVADFHND